jgi:phage shock protein A
MPTNEFDKTHEPFTDAPKGHSGLFTIVIAGLVVALAGDGFLLVRSSHLNDQLGEMRDGTQAQITKLSDATTALLAQNRQELESLTDQFKGASDSASIALKKARTEAQRQAEDLGKKLDAEQSQVANQITELKDATTTASTKINEVSTDVDGVKTDVNGVKANVASAQTALEQNGADLKRVMGDMGVMSGLIATNGKDLDTLRQMGERNYFEFDLSKGQTTKKVGDITISLKKSDPKHNRYTVDVLADDKHLEKKDKTINEPVQLYVAGNVQPYEIVVNQVKKDGVSGYLATPKMKIARR